MTIKVTIGLADDAKAGSVVTADFVKQSKLNETWGGDEKSSVPVPVDPKAEAKEAPKETVFLLEEGQRLVVEAKSDKVLIHDVPQMTMRPETPKEKKAREEAEKAKLEAAKKAEEEAKKEAEEDEKEGAQTFGSSKPGPTVTPAAHPTQHAAPKK